MIPRGDLKLEDIVLTLADAVKALLMEDDASASAKISTIPDVGTPAGTELIPLAQLVGTGWTNATISLNSLASYVPAIKVESGAGLKISEMTVISALADLDGTETFPAIKSGANVAIALDLFSSFILNWTATDEPMFTGTAIQFNDGTTLCDGLQLFGYTASGPFIFMDSASTVSGPYCLHIGLQNHLTAVTNGNTCFVGLANTGTLDYSSVFGFGNQTLAQVSAGYLTVIGSNNQNITLDYSLVAGYGNSGLTQNTSGADTVVGVNNQMLLSDNTSIFGYQNYVGVNGATVYMTTVVGSNNYAQNGKIQFCGMFGYSNALIGNINASMALGIYCGFQAGYDWYNSTYGSMSSCVAYGSSNYLYGAFSYPSVPGDGSGGTVTGCNNCVAMGYSNNVYSGSSDVYNSASIGASNSIQAASYSAAVGYGNLVAGKYNALTYSNDVVNYGFAFGGNNQVYNGANCSSAFGYNNYVYGGSFWDTDHSNYSETNYSSAFGNGNQIYGFYDGVTLWNANYCSIFGYGNYIQGYGDGYCTVAGANSNTTWSQYSQVFGYSCSVTNATSGYSTAMGANSYVYGDRCTAIGYYCGVTQISSGQSNAFGSNSSVYGDYSLAIGSLCQAYNVTGSTAIGYYAITKVDHTINFGGMPIVKSVSDLMATGDDCFWAYSGTDAECHSPLLDLTSGSTSITINLPANCLLFLDEVGIYIPASSTPVAMTGAATVVFGDEMDGAFPATADLVTATATNVFTANGQRQRFTVLNNYDGHTVLKFAVTVAGSGSYAMCRVYFKGKLVHNEP